jgi:structural maintenance of chromosome 2
MFIKQLVIDGFKSYANRTVIDGWDPAFNAITGLNGSGKSNILDAICFVLGITALSQVRVDNLQELVYKQGQSRVTKASVTVVFDNTDKERSPEGYKHCDEITVTRQIAIGNRGKYLINGVTAQANTVSDLFRSVQLNVNNPHFLIMQGRITKVVNMKPEELRGLLEEAAGTRMYENKKQIALKTIAKKQCKVDEISKTLQEEIGPQFEKLKRERTSYMQWSSNNTEIERLTRFCIAAQFYHSDKLANESADSERSLKAQVEELEEQCGTVKLQVKELDRQVQRLVTVKQADMQGSFKTLEAAVSEQSKDLVKATSAWQNKKDDLESERKALQECHKAIAEAKQAVAAKEEAVARYRREIDETQAQYAALTQQISTLQSQQLGISVSDDSDGKGGSQKGTLANQLMDSQKRASECESEIQALELKRTHLEASIREKEQAAKAVQKDFQALTKKLEEKGRDMAQIDKQLAAKSYDPALKAQLEKRQSELKAAIAQLRSDEQELSSRLSTLDFEYQKPTPDFDPAAVKGFVAKLLKLKDPRAATALEVVAGARLLNVVVETEETCKLLIDKRAQLKRRYTFIPLNRIQRPNVTEAAVARAQELAGAENARVALKLVGYEKEVEAAMQYVFGASLICKDAATAKSLTFDLNVRMRAVSLDGDAFDPSGTLEGGSAPSGGSMLLKLERLSALREKLRSSEEEMKSVTAKLDQLAKAESGARDLTTKRELCNHEMALLKSRMDSSEFGVLQTELETMRAQLAQLKEQITAAKQRQKELTAQCKELEVSIRDFEKQRQLKAKEIEKELAAAKKKLNSSTQTVKANEQHLAKLRLELESATEELKTLEEQQVKTSARIAALEEEEAALGASVGKQREAYDKVNSKLDSEKQRLTETDNKIAQLNEEKAKLQKALSDNELASKKLGHRISRLQSDAKDAKARVQRLLDQHEWIAAEKHLFGRRHSDYDFEAHDPTSAQEELTKLHAQQEQLSRKINKKVMGMYEKAEQEYQDLVRKRAIIEADKLKIEQVIAELDRKKNEALETTWRKVNRDFGTIFSTLLPGTTAKLEPPAGQTVQDGLELRVAFNGVWKESLTELSGGQRSLLALSLILAMLLFKPAPVYILDEIDAALDLSHTQNIGHMLKQHFPQSQFIVVSLKEGMFNNANVVFRTKFVEGVSTVSRTDNRSAPVAPSKSRR